MKRIFKIIILLTLLTTISIFTSLSYAASSYVSVSKSNVNVEDTFTVTVGGEAASWNVKLNSSGPVTLISGSTTDANATSSGNNENTTFLTATFKATGEGTATFSVSGQLVNSDYSSSSATGTKTVSITVPAPTPAPDPIVTQPASSSSSKKSSSSSEKSSSSSLKKEKSNDSTLKSLQVAEGAISPEFDSNVKDYTLNVTNETTQISISAEVSSAKANVSITGNTDLKIGENTVAIIVTAEDGSTSAYNILVTRAKENITLKTLIISYIDENGVVQKLQLSPEFEANILEYVLENIKYGIEKLDVEAIANLEGTIVEIEGNENLSEGKNVITITLKYPIETLEGEEQKYEEIVYTINFEKMPQEIVEPTTILGKIKKWFGGVFGGVGNWYNNNYALATVIEIGICIVALIGLSIYIIVDYKKYQKIIDKLKILAQSGKLQEIQENIEAKAEDIEINTESINEEQEEKSEEDYFPRKGRHF